LSVAFYIHYSSIAGKPGSMVTSLVVVALVLFGNSL